MSTGGRLSRAVSVVGFGGGPGGGGGTGSAALAGTAAAGGTGAAGPGLRASVALTA